MDAELVKRKIRKELSTTINTIDPAFDIDSCVNLYLRILKFEISIPIKNNLDGLEKAITLALHENYIAEHTSEVTIGLFCKNFEQFVKKIYYILEEGGFVEERFRLDHNKLQALMPFLDRLNKIRPVYLDEHDKEVSELELAKIEKGKPTFKIHPENGERTFIRLYPKSLNFDSFNNVNDEDLNRDFQNSFILFLIKAVILKNEQSHQAPERSRLENIVNFNSTILAELWIVNFFRKELSLTIKKESFKQKDYTGYVASEIERLKKQTSKFVSLSLKCVSDQTVAESSEFIEDWLSKTSKRMRILGQGGSGKTTTLEFLLYSDALKFLDNPNKGKIPVLITLANLGTTESVVEMASKKLNTDIAGVEELLETNQICLYLDGLNEIVGNRESKKQKLQEIASLIDEYPNLEIVITDRFEFDSYQNNMFNVTTFIIQKLNRDQVEEFVKKYCYNSIEQSHHVLKVIKSKNNIYDLLLRPLILTRAIEIIKVEDDLPEKEGHIIEKFIDILLKREKDEKKDPLLNINSFKLLLSFAANEMFYRFKTNAPVHEFTFNKMLVEGANKYGLEKYNAGYYSRIGYELEILLKNDDLFQFFHQSYFEFFCSHYLKYEVK